MAEWLGLPARLSVAASMIQGLPGVALQFAVVPLVLKVLKTRKGPLFADARE